MQPTKAPYLNHPQICTLQSLPRIQSSMSPLSFVVQAFVNTFGITQPSPENEARVGRLILLMLAAVLAAIGLIAWLAFRALVR